jgi:hypothetical protein
VKQKRDIPPEIRHARVVVSQCLCGLNATLSEPGATVDVLTAAHWLINLADLTVADISEMHDMFHLVHGD